MKAIRFITRSTHGLADYAGAVVLLTTPLIANFHAASVLAFWISISAGILLLTYSLLTDYLLSLKKIIPFNFHLVLDAIASIVFLIVPFAFGFEGLVKFFFLANGGLVLAAVLLTSNPSGERSISLN
ncbi:MAG: hypothetical protein F6K42_07090 [Leptolyngbya sp. SIO1D8]|nr:hypothetical protein [Leptolyngbya sp. SIO1D8]